MLPQSIGLQLQFTLMHCTYIRTQPTTFDCQSVSTNTHAIRSTEIVGHEFRIRAQSCAAALNACANRFSVEAAASMQMLFRQICRQIYSMTIDFAQKPHYDARTCRRFSTTDRHMSVCRVCTHIPA